MSTQSVRALLAVVTLFAVVIAAGLAFFKGPELSQLQLTLLTMLLTSLIGKLSTAFTYYFDGVPSKNEPAPEAVQ